MVKQGLLPALALSALLLAPPASSSDATAKASKSKSSAALTTQSVVAARPASAIPSTTRKPLAPSRPAAAPHSAPATRPHSDAAASKEAKPEPKPTLGDGLIAQNTLRIYLNRPATVTVHNARGQLLFHVESTRPTESLPLSGLNTGFLYLTLRAGPLETTKKLVYSGK